jgi:4'-phosphopantetheinyl transferase
VAARFQRSAFSTQLHNAKYKLKFDLNFVIKNYFAKRKEVTDKEPIHFPERHIGATEDVTFSSPFKFYRSQPRTLTLCADYSMDGDDIVAHRRLVGSRTLHGQSEPEITTHFTARVRLVSTPPQAKKGERVPSPADGHKVLAVDIYRRQTESLHTARERNPVGYLIRKAADLPADLDWLAPGERRRADGFRFAKRRGDWLLGRWTAKEAVRFYLALSGAIAPEYSALEISSAADGAPEVRFGAEPAPVSISLSHSNGKGLCAVAYPGLDLGCDLETIQNRELEFLRDYFCTAENLAVADAPAARRSRDATIIWSAKESALKCLREGLRRDTRSVQVEFAEAGAAEWKPLTVRCLETARLFHGWWRCYDGCIHTLAVDVPLGPPVDLDG